MQQLFVGTSSGVFALCPPAQPRLVGLSNQIITHLAAGQHTLLAAVPRRAHVHDMTDLPPRDDSQRPGVHATPTTADLDPKAAWRQLWAGDARSCALDEHSGTMFVGSEPADVHHSTDGGATWQGSNGFASLPSRASWSFPAPPHQPHTLSIECFHPDGSTTSGDGGGSAATHVVAGVEVGGALLSTDGGASWQERNNGLYVDVHSCRIDPHNNRRWFAVTGRGLYKTEDAGEQWQKLMEDLPRWYTIGLALNPEREGEVLVAAGDKPPSLGVHVAHSADGGASWRDITEDVFAGEAVEAKGRFTPVPYFYGGQALLGCDTGHILSSGDAGRQHWGLLCKLPHAVLCFAAPGQSPSSVMH